MQVHRKIHVLLATWGDLLTSTRTGIGPETFGWKTAEGNFSRPALTPDQETYYQVIPAYGVVFRDATETIFRNLDTTLRIIITTSGPRFSNRISMPGE